MLTDVAALRAVARDLDRLAAESTTAATALRAEVLGVRWQAPAADAVRGRLADAEAQARTGCGALSDGAGLLRRLATAVEQLEADMVRAHAAARAALAEQVRDAAREHRGSGQLLAHELRDLPGPSDPSWAAQVGAPRVAPVDRPPAAAVALGSPSPQGRVDVDHVGLVLLARVVDSTAEQASRAAVTAAARASALPLPDLDRYGLPGSRCAAALASGVGPGSALYRAGPAWSSAAARARALATLVERADAGHVGLPLDAVLTDARAEAALDLAASLPASPGAAGARLLLAPHRTADVAWLLEVVPGLAGRLAEPEPPVDPVAFRALPEQDRLRWALLHPPSVGAVDGVGAADRVAANRVLVVAARDAAVAQLERYALQAQASGSLPPDAAHSGPPDPDDVARVTARLALYDRLLTDRVPDRDRGPGEPATVPRRVLLFDPAGDGRIAELFGDLDAGTRNVAVLVPGTGASLDTWTGMQTRLGRFDAALPPGTALVGWLGCDLPDSVLTDAPFTSYADRGAPVLRDFVAGLDPLAPDAVTTVLGHSYGGALVGAAEREGMRTDRVVHLASAGASVWHESDYPYPADRYALMTPDDPIRFVQAFGAGDVGHRGSPPELFTRLETGAVVGPGGREGAPLTSGHDGYFDPASDAFDNIVQVITGGEVTLAVPAPLGLHWDDGPVLGRSHPSQTAGYDPPRVPVP